MTKKYVLSSLGSVFGALLLITTFQNCGGGDLPEDVNGGAEVAVQSTPLSLVMPGYALTGGSTMAIGATGGTPPYKFTIVSGPGTMDASTGLLATALTDSGTTVVRVTDDKQATNDATIGVSVNPSTVITPGTAVFNLASGAQSFSVPNHNAMTIEVWGAGGGGGGLGYIIADGGTNGGTGGLSQVTGSGLSIVAGGGLGGTHGRVRAFNGSPGNGGAATGGSDANVVGQNGRGQAGGNAPNGGAGGGYAAGGAAAHTVGVVGAVPGGGGGSTSYNDGSDAATSGGGGSGAYAKSSIAKGTIAPASTLSVTVGAGGAKGTGGFGADGGAGRVVIKWQ